MSIIWNVSQAGLHACSQLKYHVIPDQRITAVGILRGRPIFSSYKESAFPIGLLRPANKLLIRNQYDHLSTLHMCTVLQTRLFLAREQWKADWIGGGKWLAEVADTSCPGLWVLQKLKACGLFKITSPSPFVLCFSNFF